MICNGNGQVDEWPEHNSSGNLKQFFRFSMQLDPNTHGPEWVEKNNMITYAEPNYVSLEVQLKWAKRNVTKYERLQMLL